MAGAHYELVKVKGTEPEVFWIAWIDPALPKGSVIRDSPDFTESEVRIELRNMGRTEVETTWLIGQAREHPRRQ